MKHIATASSPLKQRLLATVLGAMLVELAVVLPAHSGDLYYPDRFEGAYRYGDSLIGPYRYPGYYAPRLDHRSAYGCWEASCAPLIVHRRAPIDYREPIIERRYIEREYVVRRYPGPWREDDVDLYGYGGAPRPPAAIPSLPSAYYYGER